MTAAEPTPVVDLDAIRARCDAATPGPWVPHPHQHMDDGCRCLSHWTITGWNFTHTLTCAEGTHAATNLDAHDCQMDVLTYEDAEFAAHARTAMPALLALVEQQAVDLEVERDRLAVETERLAAHILRLCSCMDPPARDRRCFVHGDPPASTWCLARDRTRAAEHAAERLEAELAVSRQAIRLLLRQMRASATTLAEARAETERLREGQALAWDEYRLQIYDGDGEWKSAGVGWPTLAAPLAEMRTWRRLGPDRPAMRVLRVRSWSERTPVVWEHPEDVTGTRDASHAPESPAGATTTPRTRDA